MAIIEHVLNHQVLSTAFRLVKKSRKFLHLTMMMSEELKTTPVDYSDLLKKKISEGVEIKRVGFGNKRDYLRALRLSGLKLSPNFRFKYLPDLKKAQRLLISDKKEMIFAIYTGTGKNKKQVFYTDYQPLLIAFSVYFKQLFKQGKQS